MPDYKTQLNQAREDFKQYVRKSLDVALALRDELKTQAQQGTEEAKSRWADLEARLAHLENLPHNLSQAAGEFVDRLVAIVRAPAPKRAIKRVAKRVAKKAPAKRASAKKRSASKKKTRR